MVGGKPTVALHGDTGPRRARIGFDYIHSAVDDHSRVAYSEVLPDEKGTTCAAFIARAAGPLRRPGIAGSAIMTDNHWSYRYRAAQAVRQARRPSSGSSDPTAPGRTARSNASTAPWPPSGPTASPSPATTNAPRPLPPGSSTTTLNATTAPSAAPPDQPTVTNLMAEYT